MIPIIRKLKLEANQKLVLVREEISSDRSNFAYLNNHNTQALGAIDDAQSYYLTNISHMSNTGHSLVILSNLK